MSPSWPAWCSPAPSCRSRAARRCSRAWRRCSPALTPNLGVLVVPPDAVSRDPAVVAAYRADPLVHHGKVPARTGAEILATTRALPARLPRLRIPLLLIHGTCDRLAPAAGSQLVHDGVASPDRTLRLCDGLWHEVMNEPEQDEILDEIVGWISDRIG